jgi:hypothetical protein
LPRDCRKAGLNTREACDAFHIAQASKPAAAILPAGSESSPGAAPVDTSQPANASTDQSPAGNPPALRIMNGMGGAAYSN